MASGLRRRDLNPRPPGYGPGELTGLLHARAGKANGPRFARAVLATSLRGATPRHLGGNYATLAECCGFCRGAVSVVKGVRERR